MLRRAVFSSVVSGGVLVVLWSVIAWGEIVGTIHAFRKHGADDGFTALYQPPHAWYRGIEFFRHKDDALVQAVSTSGKSASSPVAADFPSLNVEELEVVTRIAAKALREPLSDTDLEEYKHAALHYALRTGRSISETDVQLLIAGEQLTAAYNRELGRCLLVSIEQESPFISTEIENLRDQMKAAGGVRPAKLEGDFRKIEAAAYRTPWKDEFGREFEPPIKKEVLEGLKRLDVIDDNLRKIADTARNVMKTQN